MRHGRRARIGRVGHAHRGDQGLMAHALERRVQFGRPGARVVGRIEQAQTQ